MIVNTHEKMTSYLHKLHLYLLVVFIVFIQELTTLMESNFLLQ